MPVQPNAQNINLATHPFRWAMLFGVWLLYFSFGLTVSGMAPLVPLIAKDLGISYSAIGGVMGAWQLVYIFSAMPCGALLGKYSPRWMLFAAAMTIAASGLLRGCATGNLSLFMAVAFFGIGGPMISVGAPKTVSQWFAGRERGISMGLYVTGSALGSVTALSLTHSVILPLMHGSWRATVFAYSGFIVVASLVWLAITAHPVSRAADHLFAAGPKQSQRQVFRELLGIRTVRIILLMSVGMFFYGHGLGNWLPEILRTSGMVPRTAGFWASIPTTVGIFASLLVPRFAIPERRLALLVVLFAAECCASILLRNPPGMLLGSGLVLQGIARGSITTIAVLLLVETPGVGSRNAGAASGMFFSAAEIGGVTGPLTIGALYDATGGFNAALAALTAITIGLMFGVLALRRNEQRERATVFSVVPSSGAD
ncbi:MFS transporter [Geotalea uraniireducens]|uniref:Major facilitator superfamily MFS_1 n=1 Tax=Geotalea uraniireducens (strain Rf4) TaxID=351605 RepID=A5G893_GEOUR|nr:MFS transporter [Geotalea uraniireducens]ABQ28011.1 major facilitator superfamily MFS_1 [Geotalea uraniireducens Rf4]